jgi:hypothetical protein
MVDFKNKNIHTCPAFPYKVFPRFIQNMQESLRASFRSARFEGLTVKLLIWRFFTNTVEHTPLHSSCFLASSVSTFPQSDIFLHTVFLIYDKTAFYIYLFVSLLYTAIFVAEPYTPSAEEVQDPELFAENVRKVTQ